MSTSSNPGVDLAPQEQSIIRPYRDQKGTGPAQLLRSSIYCAVVAAIFLYLTLARNEPRYAIGIFAMFVIYLAIRVYSARRLAGIMPRILRRYEEHITELQRQIDNDKVSSQNT